MNHANDNGKRRAAIRPETRVGGSTQTIIVRKETIVARPEQTVIVRHEVETLDWQTGRWIKDSTEDEDLR